MMMQLKVKVTHASGRVADSMTCDEHENQKNEPLHRMQGTMRC